MSLMENHEMKKKRMIQHLIEEGYIHKKEVIGAMENVDRHLFVPKEVQDSAYVDSPLPIGEGQTISAPHMVGIMAECLELDKGQKVLEIGTGFGYHAAIIAKIVGENGRVYTVERIRSLAEQAKRNLEKAKVANIVNVIVGDGSKGLPKYAPYDRIFVACAAPDIPKPLIEQLKDNGILLVPVGGRWYQTLFQCRKVGDKIKKIDMGGCVFVPLVGEYGVKEE
jgi:protein-L-isoaspartate(D-aspartate) O-methyltransferase